MSSGWRHGGTGVYDRDTSIPEIKYLIILEAKWIILKFILKLVISFLIDLQKIGKFSINFLIIYKLLEYANLTIFLASTYLIFIVFFWNLLTNESMNYESQLENLRWQRKANGRNKYVPMTFILASTCLPMGTTSKKFFARTTNRWTNLERDLFVTTSYSL